MPRITLKPNSPDFIEDRVKQQARGQHCDMPGCNHPGTHRAPKDRGLQEYYNFCLTHVQDYNAAWNFFAGMQDRDIEHHILHSIYGDRPTWRYDIYRGPTEDLRQKIEDTYYFHDEEPAKDSPMTGNPELDALAVLGLSAPVTFDAIKTRYRALVKKYHPDHHLNDPQAEDLIKRINMAYTLLKLRYLAPTTAETP